MGPYILVCVAGKGSSSINSKEESTTVLSLSLLVVFAPMFGRCRLFVGGCGGCKLFVGGNGAFGLVALGCLGGNINGERGTSERYAGG